MTDTLSQRQYLTHSKTGTLTERRIPRQANGQFQRLRWAFCQIAICSLPQDDTCRYDAMESAAEDKGFVDCPSGDEEKLQVALSTVGPIAIAIDASHQSFHYYNGGVYEVRSECWRM